MASPVPMLLPGLGRWPVAVVLVPYPGVPGEVGGSLGCEPRVPVFGPVPR